MKRVLLFSLLFVCGALTALAAPEAPWAGIMDEQSGDLLVRREDHPSILKKITSGQPVNIFVAKIPANEIMDGFLDESLYEDFYNYWKDGVKAYIEHDQREAQFPQLLARLNKKVHVRMLSSKGGADLIIEFFPTLKEVQRKCKNEKALGCVASALTPPAMYLPSLLSFPEIYAQGEDKLYSYLQHILLHEFGHTLGLDDQYEDGAYMHPQARSSKQMDGLMRATMSDISCDDVDGFINLVDAIYTTEPARAKGWRSFCPNSEDIYLNGQLVGAGPYVILLVEGDEKKLVLDTYQDNRRVKRQILSFSTQTGDLWREIVDKKQEKDKLGRPVHAVGPAGEDIYYIRNAQQTQRLIVKNNEVIRLEVTVEFEKSEDFPEGGSGLAWRRYVDGKWKYISVTKGSGHMVAVYSPDVEEAAFIRLQFEIDPKTGKIIPGSVLNTMEQVSKQIKLTHQKLKQHKKGGTVVAEKVQQAEDSQLKNQLLQWANVQSKKLPK